MSVLDNLDWIRIALAVLLIGCNVGVWWGVALEENTSTLEFGKKLLIRSLALEALIAALLFVVDTVGLVDQKSEILALTKKAGDAEQLSETASQTAKAAQERLRKIAEAETNLEKRQSDFLDSITPPQLEYMKFWGDLAGVSPVSVVIEAEPDPNSQYFARDLDAAFRQAGWPPRTIVNQPISFITGIWVKFLYPATATEPRAAAVAICNALSAQLITSVRVMGAMTLEKQRERFATPDNIWNIQHPNGSSALDWPDSAPPAAVVIHVGPNSGDLFFNNARTKKGLPPIVASPVSTDLACKP
ncbi:hypothetical protein ACQR1H_06800 [Bradyrhizobium sp. HKCCYLRH2015]|uniref:hypothetical protein n=1 Tax=unclassified Bradyrhizobium TaxID=2631580 RepID=UPI002915E19F|nr:hypothetical protein [Bradyrhizobium sp. SZCCHNRI1009]